VQGSSLYITASDFLAIGKAYTRAPFTSANASIATVLSGSFLGRYQPRVLCAFAPPVDARTNVSCGLLHTARFEVEWIVRNQVLPFAVRAMGNGTTAIGVDAMVGDFDGDGRG
jgi:hypothetical protein